MNGRPDLFSPLHDLDLVRLLLADMHDDLYGKVGRFRQLADLSETFRIGRTILPGGETAFAAWSEARTSFIHGNYVATVLLCQGLAEHLLAAHLTMGLNAEQLPERIQFPETLRRCVEKNIIPQNIADDLHNLMKMRNPLSHYRDINDPYNLSRRVLDTMVPVESHLRADASFAISMAIRLLALPAFNLGG
ncbi:MAG: hypothetical protein KF765_14150 [Parvibaculaceae bacterium]|nr:hypothetical protein [Parvibaculaceae bacterium]